MSRIIFYANRSDVKAFSKSGVRSTVTPDALLFFTMRRAGSSHGLSTMTIKMEIGSCSPRGFSRNHGPAASCSPALKNERSPGVRRGESSDGMGRLSAG